jgi:hypothetical protein
MFREGWNLSNPVLTLNANEKLVLHFDLLGDENESFNYTFIHCDKDWKRSDIFTNDYLDGFPVNPVEDIKPSFNTTVNYYHYRISIPNERVTITKSGNYIISVFPEDEPEKQVITYRFIIKEDLVSILLNARRPQLTSGSETGQQIDFSIDITRAGIRDPYRNIYCSILQNGRWDNSKNNLKPDIYGTTELKYNSLSEKNRFPGGNEYRYFDIRSIRYLSEYVKKIDYLSPYYHVLLAPSETREAKPYFYWQDFNGRYYVAVQEGRDFETDADYLYVYFTLKSIYEVEGGDIYVNGGFCNWIREKENRMVFNPVKGQYEATLLLKQGWYNYCFEVVGKGAPSEAIDRFEGSFYETENDYTVIAYYRDPGGRYDRIIGMANINTMNRLTQ